jgi:outer membrane lipoprotein SlyB
MKSIALTSLAAAAILLSTPALADGNRHRDAGDDYRHDSNYDVRYDDRYDDRYGNDRYDDRYGNDRYDSRYGNDRYDDRYGNDRYDSRYGRYDNARVVRVERIGAYDRDYSRSCSSRNRGSDIKDGAVIGAIAGGAIGNRVGNGDGRAVATVAGALIGGLIGQSVDKDDRGGYDRHYIDCRSDYGYNRGRDIDYRVTYRYRGRLYTTIMPYHPGNTVRVRLDVMPRFDRRIAYRY